ncbi:hypothetical protein GCM10022261_13310 [Brevibacterium daeguense]|uniref:Uncharacterized protein n=1 Tax=Brevibacterium daeguense TaxID=909936 RepID=A0ABP8EIT4_9MICO
MRDIPIYGGVDYIRHMKTHVFAVIAASAAIVLSGCGSTGSDAESLEVEAKEQEQSPSSEPTPLTQAEWAEMCLPDGTDPDSPRCTEDMGSGASAEEGSAFDGVQGGVGSVPNHRLRVDYS